MSSGIQNRPFLVTFALVILLQVPGLHAYAEYLPFPWLSSLLLMAFFGVLYFLFVNGRLFSWLPWLKNRWVTPLILFILCAAIYYVYPMADALKFSGAGSTADNALINPFFHFLEEGLLYKGTEITPAAPISGGPGWILLNGIFAYLNVYFLFAPLYMGVALYLFYQEFRNIPKLNTYILLYLSSPIVWALLLNGHDLIPVSFAFVIVSILIYKLIQKRSGPLAWVVVGLLTGIISTSRIPYIMFVFLVTVFVYKHDVRSAVILLLSSLAVALALHAVFYMQPGFYEPLHVFRRANERIPFGWYLTGGGVTLVVGLLMLIKIRRSIINWLFWLGICIYVPHFFIAFGELMGTGFGFSTWEGSWYLMLPLPALLMYLVTAATARIVHD